MYDEEPEGWRTMRKNTDQTSGKLWQIKQMAGLYTKTDCLPLQTKTVRTTAQWIYVHKTEQSSTNSELAPESPVLSFRRNRRNLDGCRLWHIQIIILLIAHHACRGGGRSRGAAVAVEAPLQQLRELTCFAQLQICVNQFTRQPMPGTTVVQSCSTRFIFP